MAYNQDATFRFRPYRANNFASQRAVQVGADTASPYLRGTGDFAYNQNTLWGQIGHPLISDAQGTAVTMTLANTDYDFAVYKFPIPTYLNSGTSSGRKYLHVEMMAYTSAGTAQLKGRVGNIAGTTTAGTTFSTVNPSTVSMDVPIEHGSQYDYIILTVRGTSAGATLSIYGVWAWIKPFTSAADLGSGTAVLRNTHHHPVDSSVQMAVNMPITVHDMRSFSQTNDQMYRQNVRGLVTYCCQKNYGTLFAASTDTTSALTLESSPSGTSERKSVREWLYFPRQGVTGLAVFMDAYVNSWASSADNITMNIGFKGFRPNSYTINKASALSSSSWLVEAYGNQIEVPNGPGPYFLQLGLDPTKTKTVTIMALSIFEYNRVGS
jgi:hypothetical protein